MEIFLPKSQNCSLCKLERTPGFFERAAPPRAHGLHILAMVFLGSAGLLAPLSALSAAAHSLSQCMHRKAQGHNLSSTQ